MSTERIIGIAAAVSIATLAAYHLILRTEAKKQSLAEQQTSSRRIVARRSYI